eukprot:TRINITY_DN12729_c0_g6_i2.p1 TRINITY_DN12729_c0_g6~~TRINITY_DN12729_c0_g6_i2.p1  ORF type:complete len:215 (+),score=47.17 TRINITY_DN12729_c0_g6_i2:74-646(+)
MGNDQKALIDDPSFIDQAKVSSSFHEFGKTLKESKALRIAEDCSKDISSNLLTQAFPQRTKRPSSKLYSESYKYGAHFFAKLLKTRRRAVGEFMSKARKSLRGGLEVSASPLERVVRDIAALELTHSFAKNRPTTESLLRMRQKRFKYSRWYLKPKDFNGSYNGPLNLSLIHICRCRRIERCRSRWSPYH